MKKIIYTVLFFLLPFTEGCNKAASTVDKVLASFDDAISKLERQSISWQSTLKELEAQIKEDVTAVIREDLVNLVEVSIASAGVELRCNADFFRDGLIKQVKRLKNKYLQFIGQTPVEILMTPAICNASPNTIKDGTPYVEFFGYDLQKGNIEVYLESKSGSRRKVTSNVDFNSTYKFTVLIGGSNGVPMSFENRKLIIECVQCDNSNRFVSEVGFELPESSLIALHRFVHPDKYNTFLTTNHINPDLAGWRYEGIVGRVFTRQETNTIPVYRYYSATNGLHLFTTNFAEVGNGGGGYVLEGVFFYIYGSNLNGAIPLYRYSHSTWSSHYYTIHFMNNNNGWVYEGIAGYVVPQ